MDVPDRKIQHGSTSSPQPLRSPTPAAVARHLGRTWVTDTPDQRQEAQAGTPEIQPSGVLCYMGTDIYLQGTPTAPRNLPEIRAAIWKQLRPQRLSPDAAMMVLMAKLPRNCLWRGHSVYRNRPLIPPSSRANCSPWPAYTAPRPKYTQPMTLSWSEHIST